MRVAEPRELDLRDSAAQLREVLAMIESGTVAARHGERAFIAGSAHALEVLIADVEPDQA